MLVVPFLMSTPVEFRFNNGALPGSLALSEKLSNIDIRSKHSALVEDPMAIFKRFPKTSNSNKLNHFYTAALRVHAAVTKKQMKTDKNFHHATWQWHNLSTRSRSSRTIANCRRRYYDCIEYQLLNDRHAAPVQEQQQQQQQSVSVDSSAA